MADLGAKLKLKAIDNITRTNERVTRGFKSMSRSVDRTNRKFKIMQGTSEKLRKNLEKVGGGMRNIGSKMTLGLTAPILGAGAAVLKVSSDFQGGMNKVSALTGATGKDLGKLRDMAKDLGKTTKFSATESADAMAFLGQAGFKINDILGATPGILNLAAASGTDLARSADIASNIMGAFNLNATEAGRVADVLAKTTAGSNTNMEQLAEAMKDAGPVAQKYGATLEQTSALVGKLGDAGIQGSKAGTTLKNMFLELATPSKTAQKILTALGVSAIDPVTKKLKPMNEILIQLNKGFKDKGLDRAKKLAVLNEVFGKRAIAGAGVLLDAVQKINPVTGKAMDSVNEFTGALNKADGTAKKMAKTMLKGLPGAFTRLKSSTEGMLLAFGDQGGLAGIAENLVEKLISLTGWVSNLNGPTLKLIAGIAGLVAITGPLIAGFGLFLTMLPQMIVGWNLIKASMIGAKLAALGLNASMLPMIAAVGIFAGTAIAIWKNWSPIKAFFADFLTSPIQQFKDMIAFAGKFTGISSLLGLGDDTDQKLKEQGFKIKEGGAAKGPDIGAKEVTKKTNDYKIRQQKAQVAVDFSGMPKGTAISTEDKDNILDVTGTGLLGAF